MKEIRQLKEKGKPDGVKDRTDGLVAAMRIQKVWRGFATRRKTRRGKLEEMYLIGMVPHPVQRDLAAIEDAEQVRQLSWIWLENVEVMWNLFQRTQRRYQLQATFKEDYEQTLKQAKEDITKKHSVPLSEEIADEIRAWFREYQTRTGKFPEFPSEDNGGSRHLLSRQGSSRII